MHEELVGRERELAATLAGLELDAPAAVLIEGEPGIGKSLLWQHAVRAVGERGATVLEARPSESEAQLSYAALGDLRPDGPDHRALGAPLRAGAGPGASR